MKKAHGIVLACVLAAAADGTSAHAQATAPTRMIREVKIVCKEMVIAPGATYQTDWTFEHGQGWLARAGVAGYRIYCDYGMDKAQPAARPIFRMFRNIPSDYPTCVVDAGGMSVTCTPPPRELKPQRLP